MLFPDREIRREIYQISALTIAGIALSHSLGYWPHGAVTADQPQAPGGSVNWSDVAWRIVFVASLLTVATLYYFGRRQQPTPRGKTGNGEETPEKADTEEILFDSRQSLHPSDVKGFPGELWRDGKHATTKGQGTLLVQDGLLNLQRSNTDERFEIWLERYLYRGAEHSKIPKDESISGNRQIRVACEAKASCDHTLRFVLRDFGGGHIIPKEARITSIDWTPINMTFLIPPYHDSQLSIFDQGVSHAPSSIQVRNLVVAQKK